MAVNLSYALGIHKEETLPMFDSLQQTRRSVTSFHPMQSFFSDTDVIVKAKSLAICIYYGLLSSH